MCFAGCVYTEVALSPTCSLVWPLERSVHVTSDFHSEWAIVATQTMVSTDEAFSPWGSPYRSSHWIGRSTSGLRPCCCHRGGAAVRAFSLSSWWIVFELTNDTRTCKIRAGSDLRHDVQHIYNIYRQNPQQTRLCGAHSGSYQLSSWSSIKPGLLNQTVYLQSSDLITIYFTILFGWCESTMVLLQGAKVPYLHNTFGCGPLVWCWSGCWESWNNATMWWPINT